MDRHADKLGPVVPGLPRSARLTRGARPATRGPDRPPEFRPTHRELIRDGVRNSMPDHAWVLARAAPFRGLAWPRLAQAPVRDRDGAADGGVALKGVGTTPAWARRSETVLRTVIAGNSSPRPHSVITHQPVHHPRLTERAPRLPPKPHPTQPSSRASTPSNARRRSSFKCDHMVVIRRRTPSRSTWSIATHKTYRPTTQITDLLTLVSLGRATALSGAPWGQLLIGMCARFVSSDRL